MELVRFLGNGGTAIGVAHVDQIAYLGIAMTLEPGDLIATGTSSGVGIAHKPPAFLNAGGVKRIEIDSTGHSENRVVAPPG